MKTLRKYMAPLVVFAVFLVFTLLVKVVDVQQIGPLGSSVGFAALNGAAAKALPFNEAAYKITQFMGYLAILVCCAFGLVGLLQLVRSQDIKAVDKRIVSQGVFYVIVIVLYVIFEKVIVNYRPVDMGEGLEASYPSSHTMLVICVMATAILQIGWLVKSRRLKIMLDLLCVLFIILMIVGRLISGVHWVTDIAGGIIISAALVSAYFIYFGSIEPPKK